MDRKLSTLRDRRFASPAKESSGMASIRFLDREKDR
jgi:hypothetical protein